MERFWVDADGTLQTVESVAFASGTNQVGEVRGLRAAGIGVGLVATKLSKAVEAELLGPGRFGSVPVFVDSGAFSEVEFSAAGRRVVDPITDDEWRKRIALYKRLGAQLRGKLFVVAPDCVGDQIETLRRLKAFAADVRELHGMGVNVIVPIQKGQLFSVDEMVKVTAIVLGFDDWIAGVPMKKDATSLDDLKLIVGALPCKLARERVHLLGLGPNSPRFDDAVAAMRAVAPFVRFTCDCVRARALVGRSNGKGGGARALTAVCDGLAERGVTGDDVKRFAFARVFGEVQQGHVDAARAAGWVDDELVDRDEPVDAGSRVVRPALAAHVARVPASRSSSKRRTTTAELCDKAPMPKATKATKPTKASEQAKCRGPECDRDAKTEGLCPAHYQQERRGGPLKPLRTSPGEGDRAGFRLPAAMREAVKKDAKRLGIEESEWWLLAGEEKLGVKFR